MDGTVVPLISNRIFGSITATELVVCDGGRRSKGIAGRIESDVRGMRRLRIWRNGQEIQAGQPAQVDASVAACVGEAMPTRRGLVLLEALPDPSWLTACGLFA